MPMLFLIFVTGSI